MAFGALKSGVEVGLIQGVSGCFALCFFFASAGAASEFGAQPGDEGDKGFQMVWAI
jgi:hypothetical protein